MEISAGRTPDSGPAPGHRLHERMPPPATVRKRSWKERLRPRREPRMVLDPARCNGCGDCETACSARDAAHPGPARIQVLRDESVGANFAVFCQHCLDPLCLPACPQKAVSRGGDGIVRVDDRLCVHCGMCIHACPEAAPQRMDDGRVLKCDLCGGHPACVEACGEKALSYSPGKALGWVRLLRWPVQALAFLFFVIVLVGTVCSLSIGAFSLACPLGLLQNIAASKIILLTTVIAGLFLVFLTLAVGRFACGWLCPFGFVLDLVGKVVPRRHTQGNTPPAPLKGGLSDAPLKGGISRVLPKGTMLPEAFRTRMAKYGVAAAAVGVSGAVGYQAFCTVCPIGTLCRSYGVQGVVGGAELAILPALAALEISEKRTWCRYLCPVGALLALCAKIGLIRIVIGAPRCKKFSCMRCAEICPMGIVPESDLREGVSPRIDMSECIMCMRCIDACPHGAVKIRFRWQKTLPAERRAAIQTRHNHDGGSQCPR